MTFQPLPKVRRNISLKPWKSWLPGFNFNNQMIGLVLQGGVSIFEKNEKETDPEINKFNPD